MSYDILDTVNGKSDLDRIPEKDIPALCAEIRDFLVKNVEESGGHLASNLGVVELSVALHRAFDATHDHILFDTGHQCYIHKILTGRRERFSVLRTPGGLSGFPWRKESKTDAFGAGHSGTAISAAIGFAEGDRLSGSDAFSVAVIGDGAYTSGMVHEALNNVKKDRRLIIILNENEMSISRNIGRFAGYLAKVRLTRPYVRAKRHTKSILGHTPLVGRPLLRLMASAKQRMKNRLYNSNYFEEMGLFYIGPIDGNDYETVRQALDEAKAQNESVLIHVKTVKGKGYAPAESAPSKYHSLAPRCTSTGDSFHAVFGKELSEIAGRDRRVVAITAAMGVGTGLTEFSVAHSDRFYDVGIAEEHALTFAAGLAANGAVPFFAVYSTFLQRGYDNVLHDIALQSLPVKIAVDRAGLAPMDGPTHHGIFDVAFLSTIPEVEILAPATYESMRVMLRDMAVSSRPQVIRYPNDACDTRISPLFYPDMDFSDYGVRVADTNGLAITATVVSFGTTVSRVVDAMEELLSEGQGIRAILIEKIKPYEETLKKLLPLLNEEKPLIFLEEGVKNGGASMILSSLLRESGYKGNIKILAIDGHFAVPETPCDIYAYCKIAKNDLVREIRAAQEQKRKLLLIKE